MSFTNTFSEWAANGTKTAPTTTLESTGFTGGMKPPASVFNYMWNKIGNAITELQEYTSTGFTETKSTTDTMNITADLWVDGVYTYSNEAITATSPVELLPLESILPGQLKALQKANIVGGTQTAGSIQLVCKGTVPTIAIPVRFIIRKDM